MNMLPSDRYLCSLLGITEDEFIEFQAAARQHLKDNPIEGPVAGEPVTTLAIISLVLSVGSTALSFLLRPSVPEQKTPGQIRTSAITDDPVLTNQSFAPRYGFDSVQNVVKLGSTIPLVYGSREVSGTNVGGVRLNMPVIWSQMLSFGTSQMLRSVFLASEADIESFDNDLWAVGSNLLKGYKFDSNLQISKILILHMFGKNLSKSNIFRHASSNLTADSRSTSAFPSESNLQTIPSSSGTNFVVHPKIPFMLIPSWS